MKVPVVGLLLLMCACMATRAESEYMVYKDPKMSMGSRIRDLMGRMTLAEKIGQMAQIDRENLTAEIVRDYAIGSVLSGGGGWPKPEATPQDWVDMVNRFQGGAVSSRLGIPIIYGIDAVHGNSNVYKATIFPHNIGLGASLLTWPMSHQEASGVLTESGDSDGLCVFRSFWCVHGSAGELPYTWR